MEWGAKASTTPTLRGLKKGIAAPRRARIATGRVYPNAMDCRHAVHLDMHLLMEGWLSRQGSRAATPDGHRKVAEVRTLPLPPSFSTSNRPKKCECKGPRGLERRASLGRQIRCAKKMIR